MHVIVRSLMTIGNEAIPSRNLQRRDCRVATLLAMTIVFVFKQFLSLFLQATINIFGYEG